MSALVMGLVSIKEVKIDNSKTIKTSFPNFYNLMIKIGAKLSKNNNENERNMTIVIAIDGPAGSGKGTIAKKNFFIL